MKNLLIALCTFLISFNALSQIVFENGYYINNSGQKMEGLIENVDWQNNPTQIQFKSSQDAEQTVLNIEEVKEFAIGDEVKYVRETVEIDRSSDNLKQMSEVRGPEFKEETLFLKVLVDGKADLYSYTSGNLRRYFYSSDASEVKQLVYKKYKTPQGGIAYNRNYRQQLLNNAVCGEGRARLSNLDYTESALVKYFLNYNTCEGSETYNYAERGGKMKFNLSLRPGLNLSSLSMVNTMISDSRTDFDSEIGFRVGVEAEFVLGFNKNKWALLVEPTYRSYSSEKEGMAVDYASVELPFGVRHYLFFNDRSKMFVNAVYVFDLPMGESIISKEPKDDLEIGAGNNLALGVGYTFADRYSLEVRYFLKREVLPDYLRWRSEYNNLSVIFGWKVF